MMTREEFERVLDKVALGYPFRHAVSYIKDHDQEQRAVIARYRERLAAQAEDIMTCVDDKRELSKQIEQQAKEIGTIKEALQLLYDCQNGCPLPKYEADWNRAMELAQQALEEVS